MPELGPVLAAEVLVIAAAVVGGAPGGVLALVRSSAGAAARWAGVATGVAAEGARAGGAAAVISGTCGAVVGTRLRALFVK